jgi:sugar phosphate permease
MERRSVVTLLIWVMFFMNLLNLYFLNSWLPTVINDVGIAVETAILITTLFQIGGAVGAVTLGRILDRHSSFRVLATTYFAAGVFILLIGEAGTSVPLLVSMIFLAGFCVVGGQTSCSCDDRSIRRGNYSKKERGENGNSLRNRPRGKNSASRVRWSMVLLRKTAATYFHRRL